MSYGVIATKSAQVRVHRSATAPTDRYDSARDRDEQASRWTSGRLTLTRLTLSFVPGLGAPPGSSLTVRLTEIRSVECSGRRLDKTVSIDVGDRIVLLRGAGCHAFAEQLEKMLGTTAPVAARRGARPAPRGLATR